MQYGQKNISNIQRKLLNPDEILRIPKSKMIVILRGNKPLMIDKKIYTEHKLAKELKDSAINEYVPQWQKIKNKIKADIKKNKDGERKSFKSF